MMADAGSSAGVVISSLMVKWKGWLTADPLMAMLISGLILYRCARVCGHVRMAVLSIITTPCSCKAAVGNYDTLTRSCASAYCWAVMRTHILVGACTYALDIVGAQLNDVHPHSPTFHSLRRPYAATPPLLPLHHGRGHTHRAQLNLQLNLQSNSHSPFLQCNPHVYGHGKDLVADHSRLHPPLH